MVKRKWFNRRLHRSVFALWATPRHVNAGTQERRKGRRLATDPATAIAGQAVAGQMDTDTKLPSRMGFCRNRKSAISIWQLCAGRIILRLWWMSLLTYGHAGMAPKRPLWAKGSTRIRQEIQLRVIRAGNQKSASFADQSNYCYSGRMDAKVSYF